MDKPELQAFGSRQPLVAGMRMEADVLLERRRLIEWLFAPVLGLTSRI
jgi:membrane fusion protein